MLAIGIVRGKKGVHQIDLPQPGIEEPDEVLVRVKEVGLDGTDFNMLRHNLQDIAEGRNEMAKVSVIEISSFTLRSDTQ